MGKLFDIVGAGPGIDDAGDFGLLLEVELRVARDAGGEISRQRDGLVQRIRMQRLGVAQDGGHGLNARADHIVVRVLRGQTPAGGLAMRAQRQGFHVFGSKLLDQLGPEHARGAHLGDFHEVVHANRPEEGNARRKVIDREAGLDAGAQVFDPVGERIGQLNVGGGPGFLHVVAAYADAVELRHLLRAEAEDVADDPHRRRGRIDVGVADHELLENVVLDGSAQLLRRHALLFGGNDKEGHDRAAPHRSWSSTPTSDPEGSG